MAGNKEDLKQAGEELLVVQKHVQESGRGD